MSITEHAQKVLAEIDADIALAKALGNLAWEKSLRCLKTAIEGQLRWLTPGNAETLTTLCDQWTTSP